MGVCVLFVQSYLTPTPWTVACQAPLSTEFYKQKYWIGLPFLSLCSLMAQRIKHLPATRETWVRSLGWEDPLEKEMATHCSILAGKIPWTEEPGGLQSMGSQRVRRDWVSSLHFTSFLQGHFMGLDKCKWHKSTMIFNSILQSSFTDLKIFCALCIHPSPTQTLATTNLFTVSIVFFFPEWHRVGIKEYV